MTFFQKQKRTFVTSCIHLFPIIFSYLKKSNVFFHLSIPSVIICNFLVFYLRNFSIGGYRWTINVSVPFMFLDLRPVVGLWVCSCQWTCAICLHVLEVLTLKQTRKHLRRSLWPFFESEMHPQLITCSPDSLWKKFQIQTEKRTRSLKEKLASVTPVVEDLRMKKEERIKQFAEIKAQIEKISSEISEYNNLNNTLVTNLTLDEQDLSLRKLSEYQTHLRSIQKEKVC